ncbi:hypothetical protein [Nocardia terpenica]|uniref:Uncharacterized protein n=1 Tax=Nocardia terpenica TaxID=455432 RepID=A0A164PFL3_9NOCA|nr:hypothetical protein [Nocardia terpenica]KZM75502.1 hypothetical protein AWN90_19170 [Nocardia terpenica]NQE85972.1 hypothetical protein [Nocardia terpenica]
MTTAEPHTNSTAALTASWTEPAECGTSNNPAELRTSPAPRIHVAGPAPQQASQPAHGNGDEPTHDLREIAAAYGIDAIIERIAQLHAGGHHHAASCLGWEFVHLAAAPTVADSDYSHRARKLAARLADDPLDEIVATELVDLLAAHLPGITAHLSDPQTPDQRWTS